MAEQPSTESRLVVLHISDTHRTEHEKVTNSEIYISLSEDLDRWRTAGRACPNFLVISGDLTQRAEPDEYKEAATLISDICKLLTIKLSTDVLIVPGNHDVHWDTHLKSLKVTRELPRRADPTLAKRDPDGLYKYVPNEKAYMKRLANFATFYKQVTEEDYPLTRPECWTERVATSNKMFRFVGFSSCDLNDAQRFGGQIHADAILASSRSPQRQQGQINIAVWHHDLCYHQDIDRGDYLHFNSYLYLDQAGFDVGLCGHTHRSWVHSPESFSQRHFPVIAAGSLCAGKRERGDSVPRLYNIIEFGTSSAVVNVRAKPEQANHWEEHARWGNEGAKRGSFVVTYKRRPQVHAGSSSPPGGTPPDDDADSSSRDANATSGRSGPSPFAEWNAKFQRAEDVLSGYVWTQEAERIASTIPQFILGTRGSGKTALMFTLIPQGQPVRNKNSLQSTRWFGIYAPIHIDVATSFTEKGWLPRAERKWLFKAIFGGIWLRAFLKSLETLIADSGQLAAFEVELASLAFATGSDASTLEELGRNYRLNILNSLSEIDEPRRAAMIRGLAAHPIACDPFNTMLNVIILSKTKFADVRDHQFVTLIDEAELLNQWQQECIYEMVPMCNSTGDLTMKLATLPYAHARAIANSTSFMGASGNDYTEVVLALAPEFDAEASGTSTKFVSVASSIWLARASLIQAGTNNLTLADVWPDIDYYSVMAKHPNMPHDESEFKEALLAELGEGPRARAEGFLKEGRLDDFGNQYLRRYRMSLRFRLALKRDPSGDVIPRYWGINTMLRACDGNCRWLIQLLDQCWRTFWGDSGIRPLEASEQHQCILEWAREKQTQQLPGCEAEIREIVERTVRRMKDRLLSGSLPPDKLNVKLTGLGKSQEQATAVGIAYGLLVPELKKTQDAEISRYYYPQESIRLRLGFPLAVANLLPLRSGDQLQIPNLAQVTMPWWKD